MYLSKQPSKWAELLFTNVMFVARVIKDPAPALANLENEVNKSLQKPSRLLFVNGFSN
jgi:hypothetical protein